MPPALFDIVNARKVWGGCEDQRPWLVVELRPGGVVGAFPISGQCYQGDCFELHPDHPDFAATGLTKRCHVHHTSIVELLPGEILRPRGVLTGGLLRAFRDEAGL